MENKIKAQFLTDEEKKALLSALRRGLDRAYTEAEADCVLEWAGETRYRAIFLEQALGGLRNIALAPDGQLKFPEADLEVVEKIARKVLADTEARKASRNN